MVVDWPEETGAYWTCRTAAVCFLIWNYRKNPNILTPEKLVVIILNLNNIIIRHSLTEIQLCMLN